MSQIRAMRKELEVLKEELETERDRLRLQQSSSKRSSGANGRRGISSSSEEEEGRTGEKEQHKQEGNVEVPHFVVNHDSKKQTRLGLDVGVTIYDMTIARFSFGF